MKTNLRVRKRRYLNQCELHVCEEMFVQMNAEKKLQNCTFFVKKRFGNDTYPLRWILCGAIIFASGALFNVLNFLVFPQRFKCSVISMAAG